MFGLYALVLRQKLAFERGRVMIIKHQQKPVVRFLDTTVIYFDDDDETWVAHSLKTDQIGYGDSIGDALSELYRVVSFLIEEHGKDPSIPLFRDAPDEIVAKSVKAKKLPGEISEVAWKRATGRWPKELSADFDTVRHTEKFIAEQNFEECGA
jgi:hypothetical protein